MPLAVEKRRADTVRREEGSAGVVGEQIQRRHRCAAALADEAQNAGGGEEIDVMPRRLRTDPGLAPTGDPRVD